MTERRTRPKRIVHTGRVERVERPTPHMVRVVLGGEGLAAFETSGVTDSYVKLLFPPLLWLDAARYALLVFVALGLYPMIFHRAGF